MFWAHVLIIRRSELHYAASGIITPIGSFLVHETATYSCDDTWGCVMQFWPPDDEHMCSKHVEAWNKLIVKQKFCASSWLITEINVSYIWLLYIMSLFCQYMDLVCHFSNGPQNYSVMHENREISWYLICICYLGFQNYFWKMSNDTGHITA